MVQFVGRTVRSTSRLSWGSFVWGVVTAVCFMFAFWNLSLKRDIKEYTQPTTRSSLYNKHQTRTSLEVWLRTMGNDPLPTCTFEEKVVPTGQWYSDLEPLRIPEFSLVSAWLKTEAASGTKPPEEIPPMFEKEFTMNGQCNITKRYLQHIYLGAEAKTPVWTKELVKENMEKASKKIMMKYESDGLKVNDGVIKYNKYIKGKRGIVIGSEDPWVEATLLYHGAEKILTVEFGDIKSEDPRIETMVPKVFTESFLNGQIQQFDFGVSFSSIEHDGLGRYGDVLNPIGDLQTMAKMLSVVKPGGFFFLGIPFMEKDEVVFNAHRLYGKLRLPLVMAGWKYVDIIDEPVSRKHLHHLLVLQNRNGCA